MEFCECGGILVRKSERRLVCRTCKKEIETELMERITTKRNDDKDVLAIENNEPNLPIDENKECSKCGNRQAYWWLLQTRSADEPPTQFFKCTKCKHTWREYK